MKTEEQQQQSLHDGCKLTRPRYFIPQLYLTTSVPRRAWKIRLAKCYL